MNYNYLNRNSIPQLNDPLSNLNQPRNSNAFPQNKSNRISQTSQKKPFDTCKNYQQKLKELGRVRYKNQLAQLEYQNKLTQLHTKYTTKTKQSVQKKMKAKNQIAQFVDEQQQQFQQQFEELMDYKYGVSKWKNFHYENQTNNINYQFCPLCDQIYSQTQQDHTKQCKFNQLVATPLYYYQSLDRIANCLQRLTSQQANQLCIIIEKIKKKKKVEQQLQDIMTMIKNDEVLRKIAEKIEKVQEKIFSSK